MKAMTSDLSVIDAFDFSRMICDPTVSKCSVDVQITGLSFLLSNKCFVNILYYIMKYGGPDFYQVYKKGLKSGGVHFVGD